MSRTAVKTECVVFLQNAWSPMYAGGTWPRRSWLPALHGSRSGQRLARIWTPPAEDVWYDNTTPEVSETADGLCKPNLDHMQGVLKARKPGLVVACGLQAKSVCQAIWRGRLLCMPHPAHRLLSNRHLELIRARIEAADFDRVACQTVDVETLIWRKC
jgi:hypothetical protein